MVRRGSDRRWRRLRDVDHSAFAEFSLLPLILVTTIAPMLFVRATENLVEIDLLRSGKHTTIVPLDEMRRKAGSYDYHISIYRPSSMRDMAAYPILLPQRLPPIEIPLRPADPPVVVDLQSAFDHCYDAGLYARRIRYANPCDPPLAADQQKWADAILREKGLLPAAV